MKKYLSAVKTSLFLLVFQIATCTSLYASTYYIAPDGNDANNGTSATTPFKQLSKAVSVAMTGDVIYVQPGTYIYNTTITIAKSGIAIIGIQDEAGARPLLDFSGMMVSSSNYGIMLTASDCFIYGLQIKGAGDNGLHIRGNTNKIEYCSFFENRDTGCQLSKGASNNQIINCDSYYNADPSHGNADGFAPKLDVGTGNHFYGCRAWQNSDDAWDGYMRGANGVSTTLENCWAFKSGYLKNGSLGTGNGNGFKMGGSDGKDLSHHFTLKNCLAFDNLVKGFDQNNNRGSMTLLNCTGFNNGTNFSVILNLYNGATLTVKNSIAAGTGGEGAFLLTTAVQETNSWMSPFSVDEDDFISIDPSEAYGDRSLDGTLPAISFMHLAEGSDLINAGTDVGLPFQGSLPDLGCFETGIVAAPNVSPSINIIAPVDQITYMQVPAAIMLTATAEDTDGMISHVKFYSGNTLIGIDAIAPYTFQWNNVPAGTYTITAVAVDNNLATANSSEITVKVGAPAAILTNFGQEVYSNIYPNPAYENVYVKTSMSLASASIKIFDATGAEVTAPVSVTDTDAVIHVNALQPGVYTLFISKEEKVVRKKIVVMSK